MRRIVSLILSIAVMVSVIPNVVFATDDTLSVSVWDGVEVDTQWGGSGTETDPYIISSAAELAGLASSTYNAVSTTTSIPVEATEVTCMYEAYTGKCFKLTSNIDLDNKEWLPIGRMGMRFNGIFDGSGHVIKNLKITKNYFAMGLFGATGTDARISNLGIENATFDYYTKGYKDGSADSTHVTYDYNASEGADPSWTTPYLFAYNNSTKMDRTYATGALIGSSGAICTSGTDYAISNCYAKNVTIKQNNGSTQETVGGLFGGVYVEETFHGAPSVSMYVNSCYVNGVTINGNDSLSGTEIRYAGAFAGTPEPRGDSKFDNGVRIIATSCYTANVSLGASCANKFAFFDWDNNCSATNCYTDSSATISSNLSVTVTDKTGIISAVTALNSFTADNATAPVNDGYPVLLWQDTWSPKATATPMPTTQSTIQPTATAIPTAQPTTAPTPTPTPAIVPDSVWDGDGTQGNPYLITSEEELAGLANKIYYAESTTTSIPVSTTDVAGLYNAYTGVYFKLTSDIDLNNREWLPIGRMGMRFNGIFDGNGHVVKNLKMTKNYFAMGLFGATGKDSRIKNVGIENVDFSYYTKGYLYDGTVKSDHVTYDCDDSSGADLSWNAPLISPTQSKKFDRTYATGALVGASGALSKSSTDYVISGCYAKNITIKQNAASAQDAIGGLIGGTYTEKEVHGWSSDYMYVNSCYVNGVSISGNDSISGTEVRWAGAFAGTPDRNGDSNFDNASNIVTDNCYATNATFSSIGASYPFFDKDANSAAIACYSAVTGASQADALGVTMTDKDGVVAAFSKISRFVPDSGVFIKNDGWPILDWQATWLDATATDILSTKFTNTITNGQSCKYIFNDLDFPQTLEIDGVSYLMDYQSSVTDIISNTGVVKHTKDERDIPVTVYMYNTEEEKYLTETLSFTVVPQGVCIFTESFDAVLENWSGATFGQVDSVSGNIGDKMLDVTSADGTAMMTREFNNPTTNEAFNDGNLNAIFSIYNDDNFGSTAINIGGAVVKVSKTAVNINGEVNNLTMPESDWVTVTICVDIENDSLAVKIGENILETSFDFSTVGAISILEGNVKLDKLLLYESMPGELDALTEEIVLNGQDKFDVKNTLNLPTEIDYHRSTINVKWETSDESVVALDGTLGVVEMSKKVTLTAYAYDASKLSDGEEPTKEDYLATKTFEAYVVPVGSTLVYADDFNSIPREGDMVSSYAGWTDSTNPYTKYTFERDPLSDSADIFANVNKAMKIERFIDGHDDAPAESATYEFDEPVQGDLIEFSYDIFTTALNNNPMFKIGDMAEIYIRNTGGFFNWTTGIDKGIHTQWLFKPGTWQNHKYIVDTVSKTIKFYLEDEYVHQVRYNTATDTIENFRFGSQRLTDKKGKYYFDNPTVRVIMPEDATAVSTVKDSLNLPELVTGNINLPAEGTYETDIWWETSDADVIETNGLVKRQTEDKEVILKAHILKGNTEAVKEFDVTVSAFAQDAVASEVMEGIAEKFNFSEISDESQFAVTENLNLISSYNIGDAARLGGVAVTWSSSNKNIIDDSNGKVNRSGSDQHALLTATFEKDGVEAQKVFKIYVPQTGAVETISESFDYNTGLDIEQASEKWTYDAAAGNVGNARVMPGGKNSDNKVLFVKRKTSIGAIDMLFDYDVVSDSSDIMFGVMVRLEKKYDVIKMQIDGVDQTITVTNSGIKVDDNEFERTINCGEWYYISLYYNMATNTYDAFLDTERLTDLSVAYRGNGGVTGVSLKNLASDRSGNRWAIDNITVRDISIVNDEAAIQAALSEIELETTTIEWDIENLPTQGRYGVGIEWVSSGENILEGNGTVHRDENDHVITFTARASRNGTVIDKPFTVTVPAIPDGFMPSQEIFDKHMAEIPFSYYTDQNPQEITQDIVLPIEYNEGNTAFYGGADISWSSDNLKVIDNNGHVTRPYFDECVTVSATYTSKRDPSIKKTIDYKVTVWAEGEVIFREDFESAPAEWENKRAYEVDTRFFQEIPPQEKGQEIVYTKDAADYAKSWAEANKAISVERLIGYGQAKPERIEFSLGQEISDIDSLAISFDIMLNNPEVASINIGPTLFNDTRLSRTSFKYKTNQRGNLNVKQWYRFTYIIMKSAGLILVLCDGERVMPDYIYQSTGSTVTKMHFDIERHAAPGKFYFDNLVIRDLSSVDKTAVEETIKSLAINEGEVFSNLVLNNTGINRTLISYTSSDAEVLDNDGTVTRPIDSDRNVELTATVRRGSVIKSKVFNLTVKKADTYTTPFAINSINGTENKKFTSVNISNQIGYSNNTHLIIVAYDKSDIVAARCVPIDALTGTADVTFAEIDLSDTEYYRIEAYLVDGAEKVSNTKIISY